MKILCHKLVKIGKDCWKINIKMCLLNLRECCILMEIESKYGRVNCIKERNMVEFNYKCQEEDK